MEDSDSSPPTIIIEGDVEQDEVISNIDGKNENQSNVIEESTAEESEDSSNESNKIINDEFWLGFVVTFLLGGLLILLFEVLIRIIKPETQILKELFGIVIWVIPAMMILFSFIKGHKRFARGVLGAVLISVVGGIVIIILYISRAFPCINHLFY